MGRLVLLSLTLTAVAAFLAARSLAQAALLSS